jgi:hypothetical protein
MQAWTTSSFWKHSLFLDSQKAPSPGFPPTSLSTHWTVTCILNFADPRSSGFQPNLHSPYAVWTQVMPILSLQCSLSQPPSCDYNPGFLASLLVPSPSPFSAFCVWSLIDFLKSQIKSCDSFAQKPPLTGFGSPLLNSMVSYPFVFHLLNTISDLSSVP